MTNKDFAFSVLFLMVLTGCASNKNILTPLPAKHQLQLKLEPHISGEENGQKYYYCTGMVRNSELALSRLYYAGYAGKCEIGKDQKLQANLRQSELELPGSLKQMIKEQQVVVLEYMLKNKIKYDTLKKFALLDPVYLPHEN